MSSKQWIKWDFFLDSGDLNADESNKLTGTELYQGCMPDEQDLMDCIAVQELEETAVQMQEKQNGENFIDFGDNSLHAFIKFN